MLFTSYRRLVTGAAALLVASGCAGGTSPLGSGTQQTAQSSVESRPPAGYRTIPGPAVIGPMLVPEQTTHRPGFIKASAKKSATLFVAWIDAGEILLYDPATPNPSPVGTITAGLDCPAGLAVDKSGTLYVANLCNNTITEYLAGQTSVNFTISTGLNGPYGIGVDSKGNVYATNLNDGSFVGYHAGQSSPFETIAQSAFGDGSQNLGIAIDSKGDVWTASDSDNSVYEIPAGSSTPKNSGITGLAGPIGLAFTKKDELYVTNFSTNTVSIFKSGATKASGELSDGISAPTLNGFTAKGTFFQAEQTGSVEGYLKGKTSPFSAISNSGRPLGIASSPVIKP
jgi:serine/threonine-protein kinase